jgi:U4/U6 small nuclear ribonucleoprotein PRP4
LLAKTVKTDKKESTDNFYTDGSPELHKARLEIAQSSITKASERLRKERKQRENEDVYSYEDRLKRAQANIQKNMYSEVSQVGDSRPLSHCAFSPDPKTSYLATASWSGLVKLWKIPGAEVSHTLRGHEERCNTVAWHPSACSPSAGNVALASGDAKGLVMLWGLSEDDSMGEAKIEVPLKQLEGHEERINRVAFHPMGKHVISTSHDFTWRMWDIETGKNLLLQEGHVQPVYGVAIHPDGSLVATSDMGGLVRVTDLRSGRCLLPLQGHVKQCIGVDFHPLGYQLATGAEDNQVKIWDLRKRKQMQSLCAHNKLVSSVKFEPEQGRYLLTSSFDNVCRIWSTMDYSCSKALSGHGARVMHADIANSTKYIATVAFDRTFKLWQYAKDDNY